MNIRQKKDFLINAAYAGFLLVVAYLFFEYLMPILVPFILGFLVAYAIVWITRKLQCENKWLRLLMIFLFYGTIGLLVVLIAIKGFSMASSFVKWLPNLYENKLAPAIDVFYQWASQSVGQLDPSIQGAVSMLADSLVSAFNNLFSTVSSYAVNFVSGMVTAVPSAVLSILAMIISTVFVVLDYEQMRKFASENLPVAWKARIKSVKFYFTNTLFVVIRSYLLIMLLTCTELSILFLLFGIGNPFLKAFAIALFDIMPVLGTGGIMIPWGVISLVIGNTTLGIELLVIYAIVTVVRNYVEPKIVGAQLGLHPIITLVSMFVGLRLFGFFGLFGFPVAISFFWKKRQERVELEATEAVVTEKAEVTEEKEE